jgi:cytochrome c biogenesis protein CcdA
MTLIKYLNRNINILVFSYFLPVIIFLLFPIFTVNIEAKSLEILFTSNLNGQLESCNCPKEMQGGLERLVTLVKQEKEREPNLLLFDSGDVFSHSKDLLSFEYMSKALALMNYDAIALGDQDFPFISAFDNQELVPIDIARKAMFIKKNGLKVAVVSLLSEEVFVGLGKEIVQYETYIEAALKFQAQKADVYVLLSHLTEDENIKLVKQFPQIDVIVAGHNQRKYIIPKKVGNTLIVQAGKNAEYLGSLKLEMHAGLIVSYEHNLIPVTKKVSVDPEIDKLIKAYHKELKEEASFFKKEKYSQDTIYVFSNRNCSYCETVINDLLPEAMQRKNVNYPIIYKDLEIQAVFRQYVQIGGSKKDLPLLYLSRQVLAGKSEIESNLDRFLEQDLVKNSLEKKADISLRSFPIIISGLVDGVNPCAFGVLIFLLAYLSLRRKNKFNLLLSFGVYTFAVFLTYFLIGLGFFHFLYQISGFKLVAVFLRYFTAGIAFIFGFLSLFDTYQCYKGDPQKSLLQLPGIFIDSIKKAIRERTKSYNILLSSFILGFVISLFELNCTGQIYLPTILYILKTTHFQSGLFWLFLYNFMFVLPLIVVGGVVCFGGTHERLAVFFRKQVFWFKLVTAIVFFILGIAFLL